jgi:hypothetical protein
MADVDHRKFVSKHFLWPRHRKLASFRKMTARARTLRDPDTKWFPRVLADAAWRQADADAILRNEAKIIGSSASSNKGIEARLPITGWASRTFEFISAIGQSALKSIPK